VVDDDPIETLLRVGDALDEAISLLRRALLVVRYVDDADRDSGVIGRARVDVHELRELIERYLERVDSERDR
jgi:hypothetical protein